MYFDISPILSPKTAVFPGDQSFSRNVQMSFGKGDHLELSSISTTVHVGAHADAPSHYSAQGLTIERRDLHLYMGDCQVIQVRIGRGERIQQENLEGKAISAPRVLFRTDSFPNPNRWNADFNSLSPELIEHLAKQGVRLIGIDTPSIDPWDSKALESHTQIFKLDMAILEGLILENVPEGLYKLIALPLPIEDGDASPVRAILVSPQDWVRL